MHVRSVKPVFKNSAESQNPPEVAPASHGGPVAVNGVGGYYIEPIASDDDDEYVGPSTAGDNGYLVLMSDDDRYMPAPSPTYIEPLPSPDDVAQEPKTTGDLDPNGDPKSTPDANSGYLIPVEDAEC